MPSYEISTEVWARSIRLADRGRAAGLTVLLADLLIDACATLNGLDLAHDDTHFDELATLDA
jgi:predicted nucleic acid-binding protein